MTQIADIAPQIIKQVANAICGDCLHSRDAHTPNNGHFMFCACCNKLCDLDEYLKVHLHDNQILYGATMLK